MAGKRVIQQQTGDRQIQALQKATADSTQQLRDGPFGDGNLVTDIACTRTSTIAVQTGLSRDHQGWVIVAMRCTTANISVPIAPGVIEVTDSTLNADGVVAMLCTFNGTIDIWFY